MNEKLLTYRYPRTLAEASSRHPCDGEDARAIFGPYKSHMAPDDVVTLFGLIGLAMAGLFAFLGWV